MSTESELAQLRAEAAQAAAEAAEAKAAAAQAALAAAEAATQNSTQNPDAPDAPDAPADAPQTDSPPEVSEPPAQNTPAAVTEPARPAAAAPGSLSPAQQEQAATIAAGYADGAPALDLGALVLGGTALPNVQIRLPLATMNRHGLVAGATGTGKTRTLQLLAEQLSAAGTSVFLADIKGDLSGLVVPGQANEKLLERTAAIGQDWQGATFPTEFYSLGGLGEGVPMRATVTDFGPLLLSKVLGLNDTQTSSLGLIFHWADRQGLGLLDLKDLQATIAFLNSDEGKAELKGIGGISTATAGVILREIVALQAQGADVFFGEPAFSTVDLVRTAADGRGIISALELPAVQDRPALFSTFLMWLLAELFSELPEVGDLDKPKLVFFFDEAHLLFNGATKEFLEQVVQTVRLIRSKGVGIFFVTQTPKDVPADVLAQLGNRIQHALRAFTPDDAKALKATVNTFPHSDYDLEEVLTGMATGEAVVTVLNEKGAPTPVAWTRLRAPQASMAPAPAEQLHAQVIASTLQPKYGTSVDPESAYEMLQRRLADGAAQAQAQEEADAWAKEQADLAAMKAKLEADAAKAQAKDSARTSKQVDGALGSFLKSVGTSLGKEISRSIFGTRRR